MIRVDPRKRIKATQSKSTCILLHKYVSTPLLYISALCARIQAWVQPIDHVQTYTHTVVDTMRREGKYGRLSSKMAMNMKVYSQNENSIKETKKTMRAIPIFPSLSCLFLLASTFQVSIFASVCVSVFLTKQPSPSSFPTGTMAWTSSSPWTSSPLHCPPSESKSVRAMHPLPPPFSNGCDNSLLWPRRNL